MSSDLWKNILVYASGERIIARTENYLRAAELIAYLLAGASDATRSRRGTSSA